MIVYYPLHVYSCASLQSGMDEDIICVQQYRMAVLSLEKQ